jgi:hypothetical protein
MLTMCGWCKAQAILASCIKALLARRVGAIEMTVYYLEYYALSLQPGRADTLVRGVAH